MISRLADKRPTGAGRVAWVPRGKRKVPGTREVNVAIACMMAEESAFAVESNSGGRLRRLLRWLQAWRYSHRTEWMDKVGCRRGAGAALDPRVREQGFHSLTD